MNQPVQSSQQMIGGLIGLTVYVIFKILQIIFALKNTYFKLITNN